MEEIAGLLRTRNMPQILDALMSGEKDWPGIIRYIKGVHGYRISVSELHRKLKKLQEKGFVRKEEKEYKLTKRAQSGVPSRVIQNFSLINRYSRDYSIERENMVIYGLEREVFAPEGNKTTREAYELLMSKAYVNIHRALNELHRLQRAHISRRVRESYERAMGKRGLGARVKNYLKRNMDMLLPILNVYHRNASRMDRLLSVDHIIFPGDGKKEYPVKWSSLNRKQQKRVKGAIRQIVRENDLLKNTEITIVCSVDPEILRPSG
ncbi:MAG: hypothetical protein AB1295_01480 [Candidatus Micrarchaeota archaeon]